MTAQSDPYLDTEVIPYGISYVQGDVNLPGGDIDKVPVCIIDSGLDLTHVEFQRLNEVKLIQGYPTGWDTDKCSHGSHVAGTIAADRNNMGVIGVLHDPVVPLIIVKVFGDNCVWVYASDLADAGQQCLSRGAKVVSMSLGSSVPSVTEQTFFNNNYNAGSVLFVAAAGNSGNTAMSYPASYAGVISVAAIDSSYNKASFSQYNSQVELSAPGVGVLSSVNTGSGEYTVLWLAGNDANLITAYPLTGDTPEYEPPKGEADGPLCDCGFATAVCPAACSGALCLISRGTNTFAEKVLNCQSAGGVGALIYNNVDGVVIGTLGSTKTLIQSATISKQDGELAKLTALGLYGSLQIGESSWEFYDGTSMATPHVSGVAALAWSYNPKCANNVVRSILQTTTMPLPTPTSPRNDQFGYGLVQATSAIAKITTTGC